LAQSESTPSAPAQTPVTYNRDVAPILQQHCASCHRPGEAGPFSLLTFEDARRRARQIIDVAERRVMPPWQPDPEFGEFEGDRRLSPGEIQILHQWRADGLVEGDPRDRPRAPAFTQGWQLGKPDVVVSMPSAYVVPADGPDVFRNFVLPVSVRSRRWVEAIEVRPGSPQVVHHARIQLDDTRESRRRDALDPTIGFDGMDAPGARFPDGHFLGWAAGKMPSRSDFAWPLDPGNDLVIQLHLKPTGRPEPVQVSIGLYFADKPPVTSPIMLLLGSQTIDIAAGEAHHEIVDTFTLPVDARALRIYPHAHYLARDMTVLVRLPDGSVEGLLHIADWDLNWQDEYEYAKPVDLPKGSAVIMRYVFDNSVDNPRNPNSPPARVRFGPEATDEMAELLLQIVPVRVEDEPELRRAVAQTALLTTVAGEEKRITDTPGDYEARNALGVHYFQLGRVDQALTQFAAALAIAPRYATTHYNLGVVAMAASRFDEAAARFAQAVEDRPEYFEAHTNLGVALDRLGRPTEAAARFRRAIAINPDHLPARQNLARLLLRRGSFDQAIEQFEQIVRIRPGDAAMFDLLASAYAAVGDFNRAVMAARTGMELAIRARQDEAAAGLRERLTLYERQLDQR
jgi:tetratricopeptide (TPR) repeat protein